LQINLRIKTLIDKLKIIKMKKIIGLFGILALTLTILLNINLAKDTNQELSLENSISINSASAYEWECMIATVKIWDMVDQDSSTCYDENGIWCGSSSYCIHYPDAGFYCAGYTCTVWL
jgi:hypothetical protein